MKEGVFTMMMTTNNLKIQGKLKFAELFERIYPSGTNSDNMQRIVDCRRAVEANMPTFETNERFHIRCRCVDCRQDIYVQVWDIAEALIAQKHVDCSCGQGGLVPICKGQMAS